MIGLKSLLRLLSLCGIGVFAGCASMIVNSSFRDPVDEACVTLVELPARAENCVGTLDVQYRYVNPQASWRTNPDSPLTVMNSPKARASYVPQDSETSCYAAALQSGFKQLGVEYSQRRFQEAIGNECFGTSSRPLSLSQIIFATTKTHLRSGGIWYVDTPDQFATRSLNNLPSRRQTGKIPAATDGRIVVGQTLAVCQASRTGSRLSAWNSLTFDFEGWLARNLGVPKAWWAQQAVHSSVGNAYDWARSGGQNPAIAINVGPPTNPDDFIGKPHSVRYLERRDFYAPVTWSKGGLQTEPQGGIVPVRDTDHLWEEFLKGVPVLVGLTSDIGGHVVTVAQISTSTAVDPGNDQQRVRVEWVEVLDPARPQAPAYRIDGDSFVQRARFIFALYDPS